MAVRIRTLTCRVKVKKGGRSEMLHRVEAPARPTLTFVQPAPAGSAETAPEPTQTATQRQGTGERQTLKISPRRVDVHAVADRVYDLMKEEMRLLRQRSKPW